MPVPRIETERLVLREHRPDDIDAAAAMWADESVVRYTIRRPSTRQQTWMRMLAYAGHWKVVGYGYWAVEERSTGAFIGEAGFANFLRLPAAYAGMPEIGFAFAPAAQGRGLAREALRALTAWADARELPATVALVAPENERSLHVLDAVGYRVAERISLDDVPTLVLVRAREQTLTRE